MAAFFTIVVVALNPGEKLKQTLHSALSQSEPSLRIIVKDAGSKDGSVAAARAELEEEQRITWITRQDAGIYDGMNQALDAMGDPGEGVVYFLNCGDLLHDGQVLLRVKERIEQARKEAGIEGQPGIYYGDVVESRSGQRVAANPRMDRFACFRNVPNHQALFYDARLMCAERFDTKWRVRGDYEHFLRCVLEKKVRAVPLGITICDYEGGGFSETPRGREISAAEHRQITGRYYSRGERFRYRLYLILTLQPLRRRLADSPLTAGIYHKIRSGILKA